MFGKTRKLWPGMTDHIHQVRINSVILWNLGKVGVAVRWSLGAFIPPALYSTSWWNTFRTVYIRQSRKSRKPLEIHMCVYKGIKKKNQAKQKIQPTNQTSKQARKPFQQCCPWQLYILGLEQFSQSVRRKCHLGDKKGIRIKYKLYWEKANRKKGTIR